jgi:hypothetical protein
LNPFTIYSLIKISQSDEPVLEKSAFLMFFIICWLVSSFRFIKKVEYKSRYTYTYYIVLVVLSGAYAYENI